MGTEKRYLVLDSRDMPLARAVLESGAEAETIQIRVLDGAAETVMERELVKLLSMSESGESLLGRILRGRGDRISLEPLRSLGDDVRQNLRIPTQFQSFIYPLTGGWKGRRRITGFDFSCGGLAFFCRQRLEPGEELEVVIPVTSEPLVLQAEIIRTLPTNQDRPLYASKFIHMLNDEETLLREAVFGIQLQNRDARRR